MSVAIKVEDVSMMFNLSSEKIDSIKEYVIKTFAFETPFILDNIISWTKKHTNKFL